MPVQAIAEQDKETTTKEEYEFLKLHGLTREKEYEKWLRRYERNMCPADLYDDITYGLEDLVAPI